MNRDRLFPRRALALAGGALALALAITSPARAGSALGASADSAHRVTWILPNGMHAIVQHIPECRGIAISVGYAGGFDQDPAGREGQAQLLADLQFTSAAGTTPERTMREIASQRPQGFDVHVGRNFTVFTEVATPGQLAGTLLQVAARMQGVQPSASSLAAAMETSRNRLKSQFLGSPDVALYNEVGRRAAGLDAAAIGRLASLSGLERLTPADCAPLLKRAFPARGAVLSLVGNFENVNVRALLEHAFAGVPGGAPAPLPAPRAQHGAVASLRRVGLKAPIGALGIIAPALADSTYPAFFMASLILGAEADSQWGDPIPPLRSRFQYSILEDPGLARFYPTIEPGTVRPEAVAKSFNTTIGSMDNLIVSDEMLEGLRAGVGWLLGGPIHDEALDRIRVNSSALILCSTNIAERELRGGEPFWRRFRQEVERTGMPDLTRWLAYMQDPKLQMSLLYVPN